MPDTWPTFVLMILRQWWGANDWVLLEGGVVLFSLTAFCIRIFSGIDGHFKIALY